jgi:glutaredoxin
MSFIVLSSNNCKWCQKAIKLLEDEGLDFQVRSVSDKPWLKTLMAQANLTTVPQVFRPDGQLVGGYEALQVYLGRH